MYKFWNRKMAVFYLSFGLASFLLGTFAVYLVLKGIDGRDMLKYALTNAQMLLMSLGCAGVVLCSFTGFAVAFSRVELLSKKWQLLLVLLIVPIALLSPIFGLVMLVPTIIKSIKLISKEEGN